MFRDSTCADYSNRAQACNMRHGYWLYAIYDCVKPSPRLICVRDPFGNLLTKAKGSFLISHVQIVEGGEN